MSRHTNIPASYLVLMRDNDTQVLLSQRANTGYMDGYYSLVAGHVDPGETFTGAIIREATEEAGIVLDPKKIQVVHFQHRKSSDDGSERVDAYILAREWGGEIQNIESNKCSNLAWFPVNNLPENMVPEVSMVLQYVRDGIFYSEHGWENN